jgi:ribulose-phosphate 3-epimerase
VRVRIAPSILTADFGRLAEQVAAAEEGGADLMHLDVMDGHFVPSITFGPLVVAAVRRATRLPIEAHLMVADPAAQLAPMAEAGAGRLIPHLEAAGIDGSDAGRLVEAIRALGCEAALAISPHTPAEALAPLLEMLDGVTVMTVHPGRGGQAFLPEMLPKVTALRALLDERGLRASIEVDGGVKANNAAACVAAGADTLVAGSAVFNDAETPQHALASLRARQRSVASEGLPPASG